MRRRQFLPVIAGLAVAPLALKTAFAWPDQPIKLVVPFTPGTGPDIIARFVAERLSAKLGQPVVVENVAGASGNIGSQQVARAKPDGQTLMSSVNTLVMNASLYKNLPYDPVADFAPLGLTAWGSLVLVAHPGQKPNTLGRAGRGGQGRAPDAHLRQPGRRHAASSVDGAGRDRLGHRAGARALQGHGGRGPGSLGRPDRLHVPAGPCLRPAHPRRQAEGDRRRQPRAPAAAARRADPGAKAA